MPDDEMAKMAQSLLREPWEYDAMGIDCSHAWEAVQVGLHRLVTVAQYGTDAQVLDELAHSDPLVRAYLLISEQRALVFYLRGWTVLDWLLPLHGRDESIFASLSQIAEEVSQLTRRLADLAEAMIARRHDVHKDDADPSQPHELKPWDYPPLAIGPANTVPISDDDNRVASRILNALFGD